MCADPYNLRVPDDLAPVNANTRYCAVFGHPISHSASPAMQNAALAHLRLNWKYLAFDVDPSHLGQAIAGAARMKFIGLNLTVPHKILALEMVDLLDESAKAWGAVNTIRFEARTSQGAWVPLANPESGGSEQFRSHGFNTDADAIVRSLAEDLSIKLPGARVFLLGAGGAGRMAALKLASEGVSELYLMNRTRSKAEEVAADISRRFPSVKTIIGYPAEVVDLLLNATSIGLNANDELPYDPKRYQLSAARAVYDMIYRPAETPLLKAARQAGCRVANGLGMLLYQGARALEIWTGRPAPVDVMRQTLHQHVYGS